MNKRLDLEGGKRTTGEGLNHIAGPYQDGVQKCTRCGLILIDNRGVQVATGSGAPRHFEDGVNVFKGQYSVGGFYEEKAPDCQPAS